MSEKKAGVVTRLWVEASRYFYESPSASPSQLSAALEDAAGEPGRLDQLDLVAAWPPELREAVGLIDGLPAKARTILPDVLRAMAAHPGDCAALEASLGPPVSTAARVAAWAGGLDLGDLDVIRNALLAVDDEDADHAGELAMELLPLREAMAREDLDLGAERLADQRMPRRQLKGTCPAVQAGQKRLGGGCDNQVRTWEVVERSRTAGEWICRSNRLVGAASIPAGTLEQMPLAEDFEPEASDLAGLAKREAQPEPRFWKSGTVPPTLEPGMVLCAPSLALKGQRIEVLRKKDETGGVMLSAGADPFSASALVVNDPWPWRGWKLAEDFHIPEDA